MLFKYSLAVCIFCPRKILIMYKCKQNPSYTFFTLDGQLENHVSRNTKFCKNRCPTKRQIQAVILLQNSWWLCCKSLASICCNIFGQNRQAQNQNEMLGQLFLSEFVLCSKSSCCYSLVSMANVQIDGTKQIQVV